MENQTADVVGSLAIIKTDDRSSILPATLVEPIEALTAGWLLGFASPHTRRAYRSDLARWLRFCVDTGVEPLRARRGHLDGWARTLEAAGLLPRTVARHLASVSSWYGYLVAEGQITHSPVEHVRRPLIPDRGETPGLTKDELQRVLRAAEHHGSARSRALLTLLITTGLRINEALSRDVEHLGYNRGHRTLRLSRKGGRGDRTVLTPPVLRTLDAYLDGRDSGPLFITTTGKRMGQPEAWRMVRRLGRRAALDGADEIRPHSLRVAFITGAREAGVPLEDVQDAAGHADPRTTRRYDRGRHSLDRHASYAVTSWLDPKQAL
jgi:integrase/recombinase XerD